MKSEMFPDEIINNLPADPHDSVMILINGYLDFVQDPQFGPTIDYETCMDGYALIYAYNQSYDLGLDLLNVNSSNKKETIDTLTESLAVLHHKLGKKTLN